MGDQNERMVSAAVLGKTNNKEMYPYLHSSSMCLPFKSFYRKIPVIGTSRRMNGMVFCTDCQWYCSLLSIPFRETIPPGLECSVQKQTLIHFKHSRLNSLQQLSASNHAKRSSDQFLDDFPLLRNEKKKQPDCAWGLLNLS